MKTRYLSAALILLLAFCTKAPEPENQPAAAEPTPEWLSGLEPVQGDFPVRPEHPRLYMTKEDLEPARARIKSTHREAWESVEKARTSDNLTEKMLANAFSYQMLGDKRYARAAIAAALELSGRKLRQEDDDLGAAYRVWPEAVVYDWCSENFTARERDSLLSGVRAQLEVAGGNGLERTAPHAGHLVNHLADAHLPAGIAFYEIAPEIFNRALEVTRTQLAAKNVFYRFGASSQGNSYGVTHVNGDIRLLAQLLKATGVDLFERFPFYRDVGYYWIYTRRPDGQILRNGDDWLDDMKQNNRVNERAANPEVNMWTNPWLVQMLLYPAARYRDPHLLSEYLKLRDLERVWTAIDDILWRDPELQPEGNESLPSVRWLGGSVGTLLFRSGWGMDDMVGLFKVMPLFAKNHDHLDRLSFQVYCRGALALDSGIYEGSHSGYDSDHWLNYMQRTIAHNSLLIRDPGETLIYREKPAQADGGEFYPDTGYNPNTLQAIAEPQWRIAKVLAAETAGDGRYAFVTGDATRGYGDKAELVERTFVFLQGGGETKAGFVIFDRVRSRLPEFQKVWLLHSLEEPKLEGNTVEIRRMGGRNSGGCLMSTTLLPEEARIEKIGGPGQEFLVGEINYATEKGGDAEGGAWRIEVSPAEEQKEVEFLHALQVFPAAPSTAFTPLLVQSSGLSGAELRDWTVVRIADNGRRGSYEYSSEGSGKQMHLLLGLPPGKEITVSAMGKAQKSGKSSEAGTFRFELEQAGETEIAVQVE